MFWKVHDPAPDIAGLHAVIKRLINLPNSIANDSLRNEWKRFQSELPELPTGTKNNKEGFASIHRTANSYLSQF